MISLLKKVRIKFHKKNACCKILNMDSLETRLTYFFKHEKKIIGFSFKVIAFYVWRSNQVLATHAPIRIVWKTNAILRLLVSGRSPVYSDCHFNSISLIFITPRITGMVFLFKKSNQTIARQNVCHEFPNMDSLKKSMKYNSYANKLPGKFFRVWRSKQVVATLSCIIFKNFDNKRNTAIARIRAKPCIH